MVQPLMPVNCLCAQYVAHSVTDKINNDLCDEMNR